MKVPTFTKRCHLCDEALKQPRGVDLRQFLCGKCLLDELMNHARVVVAFEAKKEMDMDEYVKHAKAMQESGRTK